MVDPEEIYRLERGTALWKHRGVGTTAYDGAKELDSTQRHSVADAVPQPALEDSGYDANHSHLWYVIASAPLLLWPVSLQPENMRDLHRLAAVPYLLFGLLLGASLWYVSRRLFGNAGGYIALAFYCFSPGIVRSSAVWFAEPEVGAAWGAFGVIFTAIAVAHTLYAPREVVLWNWRRIVLLGLSLALAVGSQFSLVILLPVALGFMLYLAPTRRIAAVSIWGVSGGIGLLLLYASYFFDAHAFWRGLTHASFFAIEWRAFAMPAAYHLILAQFGQSCPALVLALPMAVVGGGAASAVVVPGRGGVAEGAGVRRQVGGHRRGHRTPPELLGDRACGDRGQADRRQHRDERPPPRSGHDTPVSIAGSGESTTARWI